MKRRGLIARALACVAGLPVLRRVEAKAMPGQIIRKPSKPEPLTFYVQLNLAELVQLYVCRAQFYIEDVRIGVTPYDAGRITCSYLLAIVYEGVELTTTLTIPYEPNHKHTHIILGDFILERLKHKDYVNARWRANNG